MKLWAGTSGYSYKEWRGSFYPEDLPVNEMLRFYAACLPAVEINNTFYRLPKENVLASWARQVSGEFRFVLKATQRITHIKRLKDTAAEIDYLLQTTKALNSHLGAVLFQLPPNMRKDAERLRKFLLHLPETVAASFEFRHPSWFDEEVLTLLRERNCAICLSDTEESVSDAFHITASWGYLRLRRAHYTLTDLAQWKERILAQPWEVAYVFFKHEDQGAGPKLAKDFLALNS